MKITPINNKFPINFKSLRESGQAYSDFLKLNQEFDITKRIQDVLCDENCVGEGRSNKVYKLPNTDRFLLKTYKKLTPQNVLQFQRELTPMEDLFKDMNVGQAIARMGQYILILIKQSGEQHSIPFVKRSNIEDSDVKKYLNDMKNLADIPISSYQNFTDEIKELTRKGCYIDYFNSNNLMINSNEINIVDIVCIKHLKQRAFMFPSQASLIKVLIDSNVLPIILNKISDEEKVLLGKNIQTIIEKVTVAMRTSNLPQNKILTSVLDFILDIFHNGENRKFKNAIKICVKSF